jgi:hypothetical protein
MGEIMRAKQYRNPLIESIFCSDLARMACMAPGLTTEELGKMFKMSTKAVQAELSKLNIRLPRQRLLAGRCYVPGDECGMGSSVYPRHVGAMLHYDTTQLGVFVSGTTLVKVELFVFLEAVTKFMVAGIYGGPETVTAGYQRMVQRCGPPDVLLHDRRESCKYELSGVIAIGDCVIRRAVPMGIAEFSNHRVENANSNLKRRIWRTPRDTILTQGQLEDAVSAANESWNKTSGVKPPNYWLAALSPWNGAPLTAAQLIDVMSTRYRRPEWTWIDFYGGVTSERDAWGVVIKDLEGWHHSPDEAFVKANPPGFYWSCRNGSNEQ